MMHECYECYDDASVLWLNLVLAPVSHGDSWWWQKVRQFAVMLLWLNAAAIERLIPANSITTRFSREHRQSSELIRNSTLATSARTFQCWILIPVLRTAISKSSWTHRWAIIRCVGAVKGLERGARSERITGENKQATTSQPPPRPTKATYCHLAITWFTLRIPEPHLDHLDHFFNWKNWRHWREFSKKMVFWFDFEGWKMSNRP